MGRPITYTTSGAESIASGVWNLYAQMERKFGSEKAWQFVLEFYKGAGAQNG